MRDILAVELPRFFNRFRYTTPWRVGSDFARAKRLRRRDAPPRPMLPRAERLVVSLTTVPPRADRILPTLRSLLDQTCPADRILLAWPYREGGSAGPAFPLPHGVELLACEDQGPATKLLPALIAEPSAAIVVVDDDVIYPSDFLETLLAAHRAEPNTAVGWRGVRIEPGADPRDYNHIFATGVAASTAVDILMGTWGYLIPPHALDAAVHDFSAAPPSLRWADDFWISGHLAKRGVPRRVIRAQGLPLETRLASTAALNLGPNRSGENERLAIEMFRAWW